MKRLILVSTLVTAFMVASPQPASAHYDSENGSFYSCSFLYSSNHGSFGAEAATEHGIYVGCLGYEATIVFFNGSYWTSCTARTTTFTSITISNSDTGCHQPVSTFAKSTHRVRAQKPNGTKLWSPYYTIFH